MQLPRAWGVTSLENSTDHKRDDYALTVKIFDLGM